MVRRIDELGRIVIPKELRKTLRLNSGDIIEIELDSSKQLILKKAVLLSGMEEELFNIAKVINEATNASIIFADEEKIIVCYGKKSELYIDKCLSSSIYHKADDQLKNYSHMYLTDDFLEDRKFYLTSLGIKGNDIGILIIIENDKTITLNQQEIILNFKKYVNKSLIN